MKRRRRALAIATLLLLASGAALYLLSRREPEWWYQPGESAPLAAEQVENAVISELSLARPAARQGPYRSREWTLEVVQDEANAWLATRLRSWVENRGGRWPDQLDGVRVAFEPGRVLLGLRLTEEYGGRVISTAGVPRVATDGSLWLQATSTRLGSVPLPQGLLLDRLRQLSQGGAADLVNALDGRSALLRDAVIGLDDGRRVRILGVEVADGVLRLRLRTEKD